VLAATTRTAGQTTTTASSTTAGASNTQPRRASPRVPTARTVLTTTARHSPNRYAATITVSPGRTVRSSVVHHEALFVLMKAGDLHRLAVVAVG
jgi:hypothetical protein